MSPVDTPDDLFDLVEAERQKQGISRRALSAKAGYAPSGYWYWASKRGKLSLDAAINYLKVLGLRVNVDRLSQ